MLVDKKLMKTLKEKREAVRDARTARDYNPAISRDAVKKYIKAGGIDTTEDRKVEIARYGIIKQLKLFKMVKYEHISCNQQQTR